MKSRDPNLAVLCPFPCPLFPCPLPRVPCPRVSCLLSCSFRLRDREGLTRNRHRPRALTVALVPLHVHIGRSAADPGLPGAELEPRVFLFFLPAAPGLRRHGD